MDALFYPFHLCHERTLNRLLELYDRVQFRDYMALQLTPLVGTVAYADRMGDEYLELLKTGRIVQGHSVSGIMSPDVVTAVDRDLADPIWRASFHEALNTNRQFQRGLVTFAQDSQGQSTTPGDPAALLELQRAEWKDVPYDVERVTALSRERLSEEESYSYDYGFALIKTSASLIYTIKLCRDLEAVAVTDSVSHHQLLARTCFRDNINLENNYVKREGY